jgi:hypothetical protein
VTARDAFGNPIDDDRPATTAGAAATPTATATATAAPATPTTPAAAALGALPPLPAYGPSKTTLGERLIGFAFFLLFAAPLAVGGYVAYNAWHTAKDAVEIPVITSRGAAPSKTPEIPAAKPSAAAPPSMLKATSITKALRTARASGGRLTLLRVAPARADLQLARRGGGLDLLQLRADGGATRVRTPGTPNTAIPYNSIDAHAPGRLVHAAARRLHRSTRSIDYVVLIDPGVGGPRWSAYFTGGAAFLGDAHGHVVRRIS